MATLAIGAIGAAIGGTFFSAGVAGISGAAIGWAVGSFLGDQFFGPKAPNQVGPRLGELQVQTSSYGQPIPIIYGTTRLAGNVVWAKPLKETTHKESGGKGGGGGSVKTFTYSASFALGLCEGVIDGITRIWADGKLIYHVTAGSNVTDVIASNNIAANMAIYFGSESQEADPEIQADKGASQVPAFRGLAYLVFTDLELDNYGNRIPNITVEVASDGTYSLESGGTNPIPVGGGFGNSAMYMNGLYNESMICVGGIGTDYTSLGLITIYNYLQDGTYTKVREMNLTGYGGVESPQGHSDVPAVCGLSATDQQELKVWTFNRGLRRQEESITTVTLVGVTDNAGQSFQGTKSSIQIYDNFLYVLCFKGSGVNPLYKVELNTSTFNPSPTTVTHLDSYVHTLAHDIFIENDIIYLSKTDNTVDLLDLNGVLISTVSFTPSPSIDYGTLGATRNAIIRVEGGVIFILSDDDVHEINDGVYKYLGTNVDVFNADFEGGTSIQDGLIYRYRASPKNDYTATKLYALTSNEVALSTIQNDICDRAGLDVAQYDATDLTDTIIGYTIAQPMSARSASEPLQKSFFYDAVEKDNKIVFVMRGNASVFTIPEEDTGASFNGDNPSLTLTRQQDAELPSQVLIKYVDWESDHQQGAQRTRRINANVESIFSVDLPIVMTATSAKQISEVLMYNAWTDREKFNLTLTSEYIQLNPADVITVTVDGSTRLMRVGAVSYGAILGVEAVAEDAQIYSSEAEAGSVASITQSIPYNSPTDARFLDAPALRNDDNSEGAYLAVSGFSSSWNGSSTFKSLDGGSSYSPFIDMVNQSVVGYANDVLADHVSTLWDRTSTVTVRLTSGDLSSISDALVLQGGNYIMLGEEVLQFANATLNSDGSYTLDTFLRGRRGTEWATGGHTVDENFTVLDQDSIRRISTQLNVSRTYKSVSYGLFIDDTASEEFTNTGVSLKPFSPSLVAGSRDGSLNITITWQRRSRYIGSPLWNLPLYEDTESYEVDIMDGATVVRTISASTETASYTAAQQITDFGSEQSSLDIKVYQLSALVGRGYVNEETI